MSMGWHPWIAVVLLLGNNLAARLLVNEVCTYG